jgi:hypothetical protein
MASSFPGSIDNFTDPLSNSALSSPSHAGQHSDLNDAVEKIETYMGLVKVIPTSVSSAGGTAATLAANGTVTIGTGNTSVTVSGAFSSLYDSYKIVLSGGTSSATNVLRVTFGSATTAYYWSFLYSVYGTTTASADTGNNAGFINYCGQLSPVGNAAEINVMNPFLVANTYVTSATYFGGGTYGGSLNGGHSSAVSHTSFTLTCNAGTMTGGSIRVYGYRN